MNQWEKQKNDLALLDEEFCSKLFEQKYIKKFARVTSLTFDELPVAYIEGRVTSGTINVDGSSNVRRTFSLTLTAQNIDINDYYWGIKTKVKLEIGLENNLKDKEKYSQYPSIIWFNQGKYVISTFNTSVATNGYTINISGKDKMCLLNGDLGGQLYASIDFGAEEEIKKFFKKAILTDTATDTIMAGNYYFIPSDEDLPDVVSNKNKTYEFQPVNIPVPFYIREGSNYRKITDNNLNIGGLQRYRLFQKVTSPDQIVERKQEQIATSPTDDTYEPYEPTPAEQLPPETEPDNILADTPAHSKPEEEPVYTDEPTESGEPPHKPYKATRVTGPTPIQFSLPVEYNDDSDTDSAEDFVFDYEEAGMVASGIERSIGETWAWRIGQADHWWPNGGFTAKYYYEHPEAINNDNYWNPHGGDS